MPQTYIKRSLVLIAGLLCMLWAPLRGEGSGAARVGGIEIKGAKEFTPGDIKKVMDTAFPGWFLLPANPSSMKISSTTI